MNRQRFLLLTAAITFLMFSGSAWADLTGTIWRVSGNDVNAPTSAPVANGTTVIQEGTFSTQNIGFAIPPQDLNSGVDDGGQGTFGTLADFLSSGGVTYTGGGAGFIMTGSANDPAGTTSVTTGASGDTSCYNTATPPAGSNCYSTIIELQGSLTFVAGQKYDIFHDDGITLFLNGPGKTPTQVSFDNTNDGGAGPTSKEDSFFGIGADNEASYGLTPGASQYTVNFNLFYAATNGDPSILQLIPPTVSTPEAGAISTLIAMLIGVAAFAGIFKKKLA